MKRRHLDNETLDTIGTRLIRSGAVPDGELDRVLANPELFSLVLKRAAEPTRQLVPRSTALLFVRQNAMVFAGAAILLIVVVGVASLLRPVTTPSIAKDQRVPAKPEVVSPPVFPPQETKTGKRSAGGDDNVVEVGKDASEFTVEHAVHRPKSGTTSRRPVRPAPDIEGDFYAVSYTGDKTDTAAGGRIIRVELKRSSLFALGVNVPLENDIDEMVTADLLVGRDGVTRGVRIVN